MDKTLATSYLKQHREPIRMRNYGRIIQDLVQYATTISDEGKRQAATVFIARCMKQKNQIWNKDYESNAQRLREDIAELSDGILDTDFPAFDRVFNHNTESQASAGGNQEKKKNKRRK